jgi:hypothetical protein
MNDDDPREERLWEVGWQGHASAQKRRLAALTLAEKLRWLEEAQQMVARMKEGRGERETERDG